MISRFYARAYPAGGLHFFACFDGTNYDEIMNVLNTTEPGWTRLPSPPGSIRVLLNDPSPALPIDISIGDWVSVSGRKSDADLRADYYLADTELQL